MISQDKIQEAVQRLVKVYAPEKIYVFGPYAWGKPDEDDDLDLLVVVKSSSEKAHQRGYKAFDALFGLEIPQNVIVFTADEFDRFSKEVTSIAYKIKHKGEVVYARD